MRDAAEQLRDLLDRETFFRELADIDAARDVIEAEHERRFGDALDAKVAAYGEALDKLTGRPDGPSLADDVKGTDRCSRSSPRQR